MSDLYIPPPGLYFRILGHVSQQVLFLRSSPDPQLGQHPVGGKYDDQFFSLLHGTGDRKGTYAIKGKATGEVLFSRSSAQPQFGHIGGDGQYADNWFKFETGKGEHAKTFRLVTPSTSMAVYSRTINDPKLWNHPAGGVYDDQYFTFLYEDMQIDKVEFNLKAGKVLSSDSHIIADQTLKNDTSQKRDLIFQLTQFEEYSSIFEYESEFYSALGTQLKSGIPILGKDDFAVDTSFGSDWPLGKQKSFIKTYSETWPVSAGAGESMRSVTAVDKGEIEVPFTLHLSSKSNGVKTETKGVWRGVSTWDLRHTISKV